MNKVVLLLNFYLFLGVLFLPSAMAENQEWKIGGKIYFAEEAGPGYIGIKEINKITKDILNKSIHIETDFCNPDAKLLLKKENDQITMTHYEEKTKPGIGEKLHATLLYTKARGFCNSETLEQVCKILFKKCNSPPTIENVAKLYESIIKLESQFKIAKIVLAKNKTGPSFIMAELLFAGRKNIYKNNEPISAGLHMTLVNISDSSIEISHEVIVQMNAALKDKMIKVANNKDRADLEFGISGRSWRIRAGSHESVKQLKNELEK